MILKSYTNRQISFLPRLVQADENEAIEDGRLTVTELGHKSPDIPSGLLARLEGESYRSDCLFLP